MTALSARLAPAMPASTPAMKMTTTQSPGEDNDAKAAGKSGHGFCIKRLSTLGPGGPGGGGEQGPHSSCRLFKYSVAFLQPCAVRSILGTGFFIAGLDANISPGLDRLTHEFLALGGGISSSDTPGNGPVSEKQLPRSRRPAPGD